MHASQVATAAGRNDSAELLGRPLVTEERASNGDCIIARGRHGDVNSYQYRAGQIGYF